MRTVLFSGDQKTPITLSDSAANYDMLRIFFRDNNYVYGSVDVYSPHGKNVGITTNYNDTGAAYVKMQTVTIDGVTIDQTTNTYGYELSFHESTFGRTIVNNINYVRVEGWNFYDSN